MIETAPFAAGLDARNRTQLRANGNRPAQRLIMHTRALIGEAAEHNLFKRGLRLDRLQRRGDSNGNSMLSRETINAGRDSRKGDGGERMLMAEPDRSPIARGQPFVLAVIAALPDRPKR
jgi:hypothetical protein